MVVGLYALLDRIAEEAGPLFQARNDGVALRMFNQLLEQDKVNPVDFRLYKLGYYDCEKLVLNPLDKAQEIWRGEEGDLVPGAPVGVGG